LVSPHMALNAKETKQNTEKESSQSLIQVRRILQAFRKFEKHPGEEKGDPTKCELDGRG